MKNKLLLLLLALILAVSFTACGGGEETTVTGIVVSIEGTTVSLMEFDGEMSAENMPQRFEGEEMPDMKGFGNFNPEDMEGFDFENMNPEDLKDFDFENMDPEDLENFDFGNFNPKDMENFNPEDFAGKMPEGAEMPERPSGGNMFGGMISQLEGVETTEVEIGNAHISLEYNGVKEGGSINDVTVGSYVTVTMNSKGEATRVVISSMAGMSGFGSFSRSK